MILAKAWGSNNAPQTDIHRLGLRDSCVFHIVHRFAIYFENPSGSSRGSSGDAHASKGSSGLLEWVFAGATSRARR